MNNLWIIIKGLTVEDWTLIVAIATFIVSCLAYRYSRKSAKRRIESELARKRAQYKALDNRFGMMGVDHTVADSIRVQRMMLQAEIEELEKQV